MSAKDGQAERGRARAQIPTGLNLLAGALGGTAGAVVTCPLEVMKTRLQARATYKFPETVLNATASDGVVARHSLTYRCLRHTAQVEGIPGLWRGVSANLLGIVPSRGIYFAAYDASKHFLLDYYKESSLMHLAAGGMASVTTSTLTNPIWVLKTRLQLDKSPIRLSSLSSTASHILRTEQWRGFYTGMTASYLGERVVYGYQHTLC